MTDLNKRKSERKTLVTVSVPPDVLKQIERAAELSFQSRSSWMLQAAVARLRREEKQDNESN